jgi:hypothetical protein
MIIDLQTTFSGATAADGTKTGQAVTATAISTNVLDLRNAATPALVDESILEHNLFLTVLTTIAATAAGAATVTFSVESDSTADLATSATVHYTTAAIGKATIIIGYTPIQMQLPAGTTYERYLGLRYTVATGPLTAGSFLGWLSPDIQRNPIYPAGFTIDV